MSRIKGIPVILINKVQTGLDPFNKPIYEDKPIEVENVLVSPTLTDDIVSQLDLTGKKAVYMLGIPKGDTHQWEDVEVQFFNQRWKTFGILLEGIEDMMPLDWNKKMMVERYE